MPSWDWHWVLFWRPNRHIEVSGHLAHRIIFVLLDTMPALHSHYQAANNQFLHNHHHFSPPIHLLFNNKKGVLHTYIRNMYFVISYINFVIALSSISSSHGRLKWRRPLHSFTKMVSLDVSLIGVTKQVIGPFGWGWPQVEASRAAVQSDLDIHSKHITVHVRALHSGNFLGYILNI